MEYVKKIMKSELFKGSLVLLILINIGNFLNYVFHFSMAKILGPIDYGVLAFLTNIIYIFSVPTASIQTIVSKYTTKFLVKKEFGKIKGIFEFLIKKTLLIAFLIFIVFSILSIFLSDYFDISIWLLILTGTFLFGAFIYPIGIGLLQGMKKFNIWGLNFIIGSLIKLGLAIFLVIIGFKVYGAVLGFVLGTIISFLLILPFIKNIIFSKEIKEKTSIFPKDYLPVFIAMLIVVLMYSSDVILAKKFFSGDIVGQYAVISMLGKMILFATIGISSAMFPISSEKFARGIKTREVIKKTALATFLLCSLAVSLFLIFPKLIIKILFGQQYIYAANILGYIGVAFSFISFLNLFVLYKISIDKLKLKHVLFLIVFFFMQMAILFSLHKSLVEFSIAFMFSTIITFIGSLILIRK